MISEGLARGEGGVSKHQLKVAVEKQQLKGLQKKKDRDKNRAQRAANLIVLEKNYNENKRNISVRRFYYKK